MDEDIEDLELDKVLSILENPIRRQILMKLSRDSNYPLQLSRELNVSQQAIMKHLKILEENDFVVSFKERSNKGGPPRKIYAPNKRYCVRIDIGPNTYSEGFYSYKSYDIKKTINIKTRHSDINQLSINGKVTGEMKSDIVAALPAFTDPFVERIRIELERIVDQDITPIKAEKIKSILGKINEEILKIESRRKSLLTIREKAFQEGNVLINEVASSGLEKDILALYILEGINDINEMSEKLNTRKIVIEDIIKNMDVILS